MKETNKIYNEDCMNRLKDYPENYFDLVLTDPPYGILNGNTQTGGEGVAKNKVYPKISWDNKPSQELMNELFRISVNQIVFGAEHLSDVLPQSRGWYCWDKQRPEGTTFSEFELIWTSFNRKATFIRFMWHGMIRKNKEVIKANIEHPTQKPLEVIKKLILNHTKEGDLVLDPFMGSGTTAIACKQLNRRYIGFEIDPYYYEICMKRVNEWKKQTNLLSLTGGN